MNTTPQNPQRRRSVKGAPDTTKPAQLTASTPRTPTHKVTGPAKLPNSNRKQATVQGPPPLHGTGAQAVKPPEQQ